MIKPRFFGAQRRPPEAQSRFHWAQHMELQGQPYASLGLLELVRNYGSLPVGSRIMFGIFGVQGRIPV
jgi:hypothetical protein